MLLIKNHVYYRISIIVNGLIIVVNHIHFNNKIVIQYKINQEMYVIINRIQHVYLIVIYFNVNLHN